MSFNRKIFIIEHAQFDFLNFDFFLEMSVQFCFQQIKSQDYNFHFNQIMFQFQGRILQNSEGI